MLTSLSVFSPLSFLSLLLLRLSSPSNTGAAQYPGKPPPQSCPPPHLILSPYLQLCSYKHALFQCVVFVQPSSNFLPLSFTPSFSSFRFPSASLSCIHHSPFLLNHMQPLSFLLTALSSFVLRRSQQPILVLHQQLTKRSRDKTR